MATNIIQWNFGGIMPKVKYGDIATLCKIYEAPIIVGQETKLNPDKKFKIKGYKSYLNSVKINDDEKAHGGVGIFAKNHLSSYQITLNTKLQAVAASVKIRQRITICSLYLPPGDGWMNLNEMKTEIQNLINQLPKPFLLLGDINAHHPLWFDQRPQDKRGEMLVDLIADNDVGLLDRNKPTCLWKVDKSYSHIDLSLCSSDLLELFHWDTHNEPMNSDHFPVLLKCNERMIEKRPERWLLNKADWNKFKNEAKLPHSFENDVSVDEAATQVEETITEAAKSAIPKSKGVRGSKKPAWWNNDCQIAIQRRKATFKRFSKTISRHNYLEYQKAKAIARRIIGNSKKKSWRKFIESINSKMTSKEVWRRIRILMNKYSEESLNTLKVNPLLFKISNIPRNAKYQVLQELTQKGCIQTINETETDNDITFMIRFEKDSHYQAAMHLDGQILGQQVVKAEILQNDTEKPVLIDDEKEIVDCLARRFHYISKIDKFDTNHQNEDELNYDFSTTENLGYNKPITKKELEYALAHSSESAPGPDTICYSMLKNLSEEDKENLLLLFNKIFKTGRFPKKWKESIVIPILKQDKDSTDPGGYRPIALTSCLCKLFEKILNRRLVWILESKGILSKHLNGFRPGRGTSECIISLMNQIYDAFRRSQYILTVFLDLEKAYDTCWKKIIIRELHDIGLRGQLPAIIADYLEERMFKVRVGVTNSDIFVQELGVPQGGVLSCTLFNIAINTVVKSLSGLISYSLYVDDQRISYASQEPIMCKIRVQRVLNELEKWAKNNGFKFSPQKTQFMFFYRNLKKPLGISLTINGEQITEVESKKFLGVVLDRKLSWDLHIQQLKVKCLRDINILYILAKQNENITCQMLLTVYKIIIRSKLDYNCVAYGTAPESNLQTLDVIHHKALRISLGAFPTSPKESLYALTGEPSLSERREMLTLQYYARIQQLMPIEKPVNLDDRSLDGEYSRKSNKPIGLGFKIRSLSQSKQIQFPAIETFKGYLWCDQIQCIHNNCPKAPWNSINVKICLALTEVSKNERTPEMWKNEFLVHRHNSDMEIYTDGSKNDDGVGAGYAILRKNKKIATAQTKLPVQASAFTAELTAIKMALLTLKPVTNKNVTIYSDSQSSIQAIKYHKKLKLVSEIFQLLKNTKKNEVNVTICWIPGHVGIIGNEYADNEAKEATKSPCTIRKEIPYKDVKAHIKASFKKQRIIYWKNKPPEESKLRAIMAEWNSKPPNYGLKRKDTIKIIRLQIGHTKLTHRYIYDKFEPRCQLCADRLTVKHVLLQCEDFNREDFYKESEISLKTLLTTKTNMILTIKFLKLNQVYHLI